MRISTHFTLEEATRSMAATRRGIDNNPPPEIIPVLVTTAERVLEPIRHAFSIPFAPSSWYRSPRLNEAIGGSPRSQHVKGEAVDIELPGVDNWVLAQWIFNNLEYDQLILEFMKDHHPTAGWVHVSFSSDRNRQETLRVEKGKGYYGWRF